MKNIIDNNEDLLDTITFDRLVTELTGMTYNEFQKEFNHYEGDNNDLESNME